jgi:aminoglycoside phosphotransferase (APT) family kinase protein
MEIEALRERSAIFCRAMHEDDSARVTDVQKMPGHAGFSYGFAVQSREEEASWYLRLPPPNVRWEKTADVLRQVMALKALDETDDGKLLAVIDWELVGIGATLNDVGWIATFSDANAWATEGFQRPIFMDADTLIQMYEEAHGSSQPDSRWHRALVGL